MMVASGKVIERKYIGSDFQEVCELPNLIGVQLDSYERFLQLDRIPTRRQDSSMSSGTPFRSPAPMVT